MRRTFWIARTDLPVVPVTYSRSRYFALSVDRRRPALLRSRGAVMTGLRPATAARPEVEADQHAFLVGQVADDLLHRRRQMADQRRHRDDLIAARQLRLLQQVDDFDAVAPGEMLLADRLEIPQRRGRAGALPGDVEPQDPLVRTARRFLLAGSRFAGPAPPRARRATTGPSSVSVNDAPLRRVRHAARLQDRQVAAAVLARRRVAQQDPGVHSDDTPTSMSCRCAAARNEVREHAGDVPALQEVDQPHHHAVDFAERCRR